MRQRLTLGLAIGAAAAMALAGCGSGSNSGSGSGGTTTLSFFGADYGTGPANSTTKYWDAIAAAFHKANPEHHGERADRRTGPTSRTRSRRWCRTSSTRTSWKGDTGTAVRPEPPALLRPAGAVAAAVLHNLIPTFLKDGQYQGTDYGIPFTTSTRALYYNKKIFAAAGISSPPTDLGAAAAPTPPTIKAKGYIGYGMPLGSEEAQAEALLWFLGDGGGYVNSGGSYAINSAPNVHALDFMSQLVKAGDTQPSPGTTDRKDVWASFAQGQVGMMLGSPAVIPIIQAAGVL